MLQRFIVRHFKSSSTACVPVGDLLATENDPEMRQFAEVYANRAAARQGLTASTSVTVDQLRRIIAGKLRGTNDDEPGRTRNGQARSLSGQFSARCLAR